MHEVKALIGLTPNLHNLNALSFSSAFRRQLESSAMKNNVSVNIVAI